MRSALDNFRCLQDLDIEDFLRHKAIEFEERDFCSVYLIVDEQKFDTGELFVVAYFTLSHKTIFFTNDVSKTTKGKVTALRSADFGNFVLIGQLGKYMTDKEHRANISSKEILDYAFTLIHQASTIIVCRAVLVECSAEPNVQRVYQNYGFSYLQFDGEHHQFYTRLH